MAWPEAAKQCDQMENGYKLASFEDSHEAESVMGKITRVYLEILKRIIPSPTSFAHIPLE